MSDAAVITRGLGKNYFDGSGNVIRACIDLDFTAHYGQVFGLLGTNGAGKTTTLRMLSTVLTPTSGDARLAGKSIVHEPEAVRQSIGFLSAGTGIYGRLTAREMMVYFGRLHDLDAAEAKLRAEEIAVSLDMGEFLDRRCDKLSSGQRQRVSIARTIMHDPPILIFDEPTTGLDILAASQIVEFIKESRDRGRCVILSTHIMHEAERLCDDILILHAGEARAYGTLRALRSRYGDRDLDEIFLDAIRESAL